MQNRAIAYVPMSVYAAGIFGAINVGYKWIKANGTEQATNDLGRDALRTGGLVLVLGFLSLVPGFTVIASAIAMIYIAIVVLNTGNDILQDLGAI
jgi:hypothetical protein